MIKIKTAELYQGDCMDLMKTYPDKYFDLAIVDPPYSDGCRLSKCSVDALAA